MLEQFTDTNPLRHPDFRTPADGMSGNLRDQGRSEKEAQAKWLHNQTNKVCELADQLLTGESVTINNNSFSYRQVIVELKMHPLYDKALNALTLGNADPMNDLTLRVARRAAAFMLRIDPEELGLGA